MMLVVALPAGATLQLLRPDTNAPSTFVGHGGYSADGLGQSCDGPCTGTVTAEVPIGSTVVHAYLYGTYFTGNPDDSQRTIDFDGTSVLLPQISTVGYLSTARADVTQLVAAKVGSPSTAPRTDFVIGNDPSNLDGVALVVVYSNPTSPQTTVAILDGSAQQGGDTATFTFAQPLAKGPNFHATMSVGSGFSYDGGQPSQHLCTGNQVSIIDVNDQRLTSCAGNYDDGYPSNGGLITVGGVDDSTDNPPPDGNSGTDDELYNLDPFLHNGDSGITIKSSNPSGDDNFFLAVIDITATGRVTTETCTNGIDDDGDGLVDAQDPDCHPDIAITQADSPDPVPPDSLLTYTLTVRNNGTPDAQSVSATDRLPSGVQFVSATPSQGSCNTDDSGAVQCALGPMAKGASATITIVVRTPQTEGTLTNTATATGDQLDPDTSNNTSTETTTVGSPGPPAATSASVGDTSVVEGTGSNSVARFTVSLSSASSQAVTVDYSTSDGTAHAGSDYEARSGTLTFAPGETTKTVDVPVVGDSLNEPDETFNLDLSNPSLGTSISKAQGTATIKDDDPRPRVTISDASIKETDSGQVAMVFNVTLDRPSGEPTGVDWATEDGSAVSGSDYVGANGTVGFAPGETSRTINVLVNGDTAFEPNETFFVNLVSLSQVEPARNRATGTIIDDDPVPPPVYREKVDGGAASGDVCYQLPNSSTCQPLSGPTQFPIGTLINATNGRVTLTIIDAQGHVQSADFYEGAFVIAAQTADGTLVLTLAGGDFNACGAQRLLAAASPPSGGGKSVRHLWGDGKGKFRTAGRYASATVRGTKWLTDDRCAGTLVFVDSGIVDVFDAILQRTVTLTAGGSYLAQPTVFLPVRSATQCRTVRGKRVCVTYKLACKTVNRKSVCTRVGKARRKP